MTKNTIGGKGHKKSKKNINVTRNIPFKQEGCDYGRVKELLGNGRLRVITFNDNMERIGHIRGSMYKKIWICKDDIVLVSLREFEDNKCDIIYKYENDDVKYLIKSGQIQNGVVSDKNLDNNDQEHEIIFEEQDRNYDFDIDEI